MPSPPLASVSGDVKKHHLLTVMSLINLGLHIARPAVPQKYGRWFDVGHAVLDTLADNEVAGLENPDSPSAIQPTRALARAILVANDDPAEPLEVDGSVRNSLLGL